MAVLKLPAVLTGRALAAADCSAATAAGHTALHLAASLPDDQEAVRAVRQLLQRGASPSARCKAGHLPLHAAARQGNPAALAALLGAGGLRHLDTLADGPCGGAALHLAAERGAVEAAEQLLLAGADANLRRRDGLAPLHVACLAPPGGGRAMVQLLLNHGADPRKLTLSGEAAAHLAAEAGAVELLLCLAQHDPGLLAMPADAPASGTPLHVLARRGHAAALEALLSAPHMRAAAALAVPDGRGLTPLGAACAAGQLAAAQALLAHQQQLPASGALGALAAACEAGHSHIVRLLLSRASDAMNWADVQDSRHPLAAAVQHGRWAVMRVLLEAGVPPPVDAVVDAALRLDVGDELLDKLLRASPGAGARLSPEQAQQLYGTVLTKDSLALLERLLGWGLDPQTVVLDVEQSPLLHTISTFNWPAARVLLRHGACPDGLRGEEEAPLLAAARMLDLEGVQLLLGAGADPGAVAWGRTALDFVLETCTDDAALDLTGEMWPAARTFSERHLLALVEALVAGGCESRAFFKDGPDHPELVHPTLLLALGRPRWSPEEHGRWPAGFRAAARAFLLAARGRGVAAGSAAAATAGPCRAAKPGQQRPGRLAGMLGRPAAGQRAKQARVAQQQQQGGVAEQERVILPLEVCLAVLEAASTSVSEWV